VGTWGTGAFDDDVACDWADGLEAQTSLFVVESTLDRVLAVGGDNLDSGDAREGLAAAEVVARLLGRPGERTAHTAVVDAWVAQIRIAPSAALVGKARQVLARVRREPSELLDAWSEVPDHAKWLTALADIEARLTGGRY
jgi:hypothetical protein